MLKQPDHEQPSTGRREPPVSGGRPSTAAVSAARAPISPAAARAPICPAYSDALAGQLREAVAQRAATLASYGTGAVLQRHAAPARQAATARFNQAVIQRRELIGSERVKLAATKARLGELEGEYRKDKATIEDALEIKNAYNDPLKDLHSMDLGYISGHIVTADRFFREANELARQAHSSDKSYGAFVRKVNGYDNSGGKNAIKNVLVDLDRKLKSRERDNLNQVTALDEEHFKQYRLRRKPPITVYRGNGIGVNANSLDNYVFQNIPAGGTPDVSFYGVVQHTHTNTMKNGMVSTTTDFNSAKFFATNGHKHGIVFEFVLDDYIHVTKLLKERNFRERFPGQFEIMAPRFIPASKAVSATLFENGKEIKKVTNT